MQEEILRLLTSYGVLGVLGFLYLKEQREFKKVFVQARQDEIEERKASRAAREQREAEDHALLVALNENISTMRLAIEQDKELDRKMIEQLESQSKLIKRMAREQRKGKNARFRN